MRVSCGLEKGWPRMCLHVAHMQKLETTSIILNPSPYLLSPVVFAIIVDCHRLSPTAPLLIHHQDPCSTKSSYCKLTLVACRRCHTSWLPHTVVPFRRTRWSLAPTHGGPLLLHMLVPWCSTMPQKEQNRYVITILYFYFILF